MAEPPVSAGACHLTETSASPPVAVTSVGLPGALRGTMGEDPRLGFDVPRALVAVAVKVYVVPFVRPVTVHEVADAPEAVHVRPPGLAVTV